MDVVRKRPVMCKGCPWNPDREGPMLDADTWDTVMSRIRSGERWICHETTDGPRLTERTQFCAGAPSTFTATVTHAAEQYRIRLSKMTPEERTAHDEEIRQIVLSWKHGPELLALMEKGPDACTGLTAMWCPIHGNCTCPEGHGPGERDMDGLGMCPLHSMESTHPIGDPE